MDLRQDGLEVGWTLDRMNQRSDRP